MKGVLIDSDVIIDVLRGRDASLLSQWADLAAGSALLTYSPVTAAEIWHGVREGEQAVIGALFEAMTCIPIDEAIGRVAGDYLRRYRRSHSLALGDALIAATAAIHKMPLWTRNRKHYPMKEVRHWENVQ
jgi:predicted nucleic acid-binding protein